MRRRVVSHCMLKVFPVRLLLRTAKDKLASSWC